MEDQESLEIVIPMEERKGHSDKELDNLTIQKQLTGREKEPNWFQRNMKLAFLRNLVTVWRVLVGSSFLTFSLCFFFEIFTEIFLFLKSWDSFMFIDLLQSNLQ